MIIELIFNFNPNYFITNYLISFLADPIVIEKGTFAWEDESTVSTPALRDITMRVQDGAMVAVVGVVGSGKSTLLSALLGELTKISGKVNTRVII